LRERLEDVKELTRYYASKLCEDYGIMEKRISPEVFDILARYQWPGNIRELVHGLERAISAAMEDPVLFPMHLPTHIRVGVARASVASGAIAVGSGQGSLHDAEPLPRLQEFREAATIEAEQQYLKDLLRVTGGNVPKACHISGLSRSRLYSLLKKYHLSASG
jgi:two-component system NtrC family response regulator